MLFGLLAGIGGLVFATRITAGAAVCVCGAVMFAAGVICEYVERHGKTTGAELKASRESMETSRKAATDALAAQVEILSLLRSMNGGSVLRDDELNAHRKSVETLLTRNNQLVEWVGDIQAKALAAKEP